MNISDRNIEEVFYSKNDPFVFISKKKKKNLNLTLRVGKQMCLFQKYLFVILKNLFWK